ncbi:MAG: CcmD family protein [Chitinophagaceae bacterium]|nr:CcmD family protein [Chitinophagaceae bacterium]
MKRILFTLLSLFITFVAFSQNDQVIPKTDPALGLRADGKIWVVMAVCLTILAGLFIYVISIDRKISRLEKNSR